MYRNPNTPGTKSADQPTGGHGDMSEYTDTKARKLIKSGKIAKVDDNMWQVAGSKPNTMYVVTLEPLHCDCMGFVFRHNCSHIRAVEMAKADEQ